MHFLFMTQNAASFNASRNTSCVEYCVGVGVEDRRARLALDISTIQTVNPNQGDSADWLFSANQVHQGKGADLRHPNLVVTLHVK